MKNFAVRVLVNIILTPLVVGKSSRKPGVGRLI